MNIPLPLSQLPLPLSRFLPLSRRRPGLARFSLPATTSPARPPLLSAISSSRPCHSVAAAPWWRLTEAPPQPPPSTPPCPLPPPPPSSGARARKERRFVRGCVGGQESWWDGLGIELLGFDALLQIKEEIAGGHNGGVNLPGTCSFLMAFSTALHSQWILLRSACALTPVCWSLVKKCQAADSLCMVKQLIAMKVKAAGDASFS
uniref:Uncharacterized protein n=1 Tax=Oryza glumipatula TaxID=40148 RepID=A0A0E0BLS8_9ORYZ